MLKEKDFVEIDFTGRIADSGKVFDTTEASVAVKAGLPKATYKPVVVCLGAGMLPAGLEKSLIGKIVGDSYKVTLKPVDAFGERKSELIQTVPVSPFLSQGVRPESGQLLSVDGRTARVLSVSGGRVVLDFNHLLAGKTVCYTVTVLRKVNSEREKLLALLAFYSPDSTLLAFDEAGKKATVSNCRNKGTLSKKVRKLIGFTLSFSE